MSAEQILHTNATPLADALDTAVGAQESEMFAFGVTVVILLWWWQGILGSHNPLIPSHSISLKDAQGLSLCSYEFDTDVQEDRVPRVIEIARCFSCGKDCNPHGKATATCMQLMSTILVAYKSTGLLRNETFPVACVCINRFPKKGLFDEVNIVT